MKAKAFILFGSEEKTLLAGINANLEKNNIAKTDELNFTPLYQKDNKYHYEAVSADFAVKQNKGETFTPVWTIPIENRDLAFIVGIVPDPQKTRILADKKVTVDENGFFVYVFEGTGKAPKVTIMNGTHTIS